MVLDDNIKHYKKELGDLPLWLKYAVAIATIFGTIFGGWGVYIVISDKNNKDRLLDSTTATSSIPINITSILSMALHKDTAMEQRDFLNKYEDVKVFVDGYFKDILNYGENYQVFIDSSLLPFGNMPIVCSLDNLSEDEKRELFLFKKRDKVLLRGVFTGGNYNGIAWYVKECRVEK